MTDQAQTPNGAEWRWNHEWMNESPHKAASSPHVDSYSDFPASPILAEEGWGVKADAVEQPPNYRPATKRLNASHCGSCKMYSHGKCWGYGNKSVEKDYVCDSYAPSNVKQADNSYQWQTDTSQIGTNEVDRTTSSFAEDLEWNSTVFDGQGRVSTCHIGANADELFIALNVPKPTADEIFEWVKKQDWPKGTELENPSEYHITLLYSPKGHEEHREAEWWATDNSDSIKIEGIEEFPSQERGELSAFVLRCDTHDKEIKTRMDRLLDKAEEEGVEVNRYPSGSKPHITVAYGPKLPEGLKPPPITFSSDEAHCGKPRISSVFGDVEDRSHQSNQKNEKSWDQQLIRDRHIATVKDYPNGRLKKHDSKAYNIEHSSFLSVKKGLSDFETNWIDPSDDVSILELSPQHKLDDPKNEDEWEDSVSHDSRIADYNVQVPVVTPNQGVGLATPHQVADLLSIQSVAHNLHYKFEQSGLDPTSAQQYAGRLLQAIGYTNPDQPTIAAAIQAWMTMYPDDSRALHMLPGVATFSFSPMTIQDQGKTGDDVSSHSYGDHQIGVSEDSNHPYDAPEHGA